MDLSDEELKTLRWFLNQAHNDIVWAQVDDKISFLPISDIVAITRIGKEFDEGFEWLSDGRTPWDKWWF